MGFDLDHGDGDPRDGGKAADDDLVQIIEGEIIPRLFLAHRGRAPHRLAAVACGDTPDPEFLALDFLGGDSAGMTDRLQALLDGGMPRAHVYLEVLAPVPGTLSRFWAEGRCNLDEVTAGLCCIDEVLKKLHERENLVAH